MLLTLRPLHFLMSAISFPQIFQVCTTVILLSIMWFLCSFTDWVQASRIMRSMCRENMLLKNTYISFICIMSGGRWSFVHIKRINEAEVDVSLKFSYFSYDPTDAGNLISCSSAFSKTNLYVLKFSVLVQLKPSLKDFEHYLAGMWNESYCVVVWAFFGIAFHGILMKTHLFQCCGHCWVFQICWHIACSTLATSSFRIWNSSSGTPSPPLALFAVVLTEALLTLHSRLSGSWWVIRPLWLCWSIRSFLCSSFV